MKSEQINELALALSHAQSEIKGAKADSANPFFKSKYADLHSVWEACRPALAKYGLSVVQTTDEDKETSRVILVTTLLHKSGQWIEGRLPLYPKAMDAQSIGGAITYGRRYALSAIVGIAQEDDDGESAMARPQQNSYSAPKPSAYAKPVAAPVKKAVPIQRAMMQQDVPPPVDEDIPF